jgi:hypothetical protein
MDKSRHSELVKRLVAIFPGFEADWHADNEDIAAQSDTLHSVYQSFLPFAATVPATKGQLASLATLLNEEVAAGGDRENAVATCFLEHCAATGLFSSLRPLLNAEAQTRLHA